MMTRILEHVLIVIGFQIPQLLSNGLNVNTTRSLVLMDKSFIMPTGLGMPINCSINSTAVVSLRLRSQFSIKLPKIVASGYIAPRYSSICFVE